MPDKSLGRLVHFCNICQGNPVHPPPPKFKVACCDESSLLVYSIFGGGGGVSILVMQLSIAPLSKHFRAIWSRRAKEGGGGGRGKDLRPLHSSKGDKIYDLFTAE